jgi:two-component system, sensor histidine kinase RegB
MFDLEPMITLPWLVRLRWLFVIGQLLVFAVVRFGVGAELPWWPFAMAVGVTAISNVAIASKRSHRWPPAVRMGSVLLLDTVLLTVELSGLGGATNPFTVMYLVYITLSAVVLSARWTSLVAVLAIACFALLFAVPAETHVHHSGPPLLNPHLQGMWAAFVIAAVLMGFFVRKISRAIAMQREEIASLRETAARNARLASLATLAAGAAHELNTPLSTIAVAAHEACVRAKQLADGTSVAADLDLILEQVDRCQRIIHQMAARATSTDREDVISLDELVGELRQQLGTRATAVDVELSGAPEKMSLPASLVVQSLGALVKNALDASKPDDRVRIAIRREPTAVSFAVHDHGAGIPQDVLARVGDPFFTTKPAGSGLGLGVFLARVFFESRGGELSIESTLGVGTQAHARIPLAS